MDCCTSINRNSMSGKIHQIFSFIIITYILLISSYICPVKLLVMMRKFNINRSDNIYTVILERQVIFT